jgi:hypothetical protein
MCPPTPPRPRTNTPQARALQVALERAAAPARGAGVPAVRERMWPPTPPRPLPNTPPARAKKVPLEPPPPPVITTPSTSPLDNICQRATSAPSPVASVAGSSPDWPSPLTIGRNLANTAINRRCVSASPPPAPTASLPPTLTGAWSIPSNPPKVDACFCGTGPALAVGSGAISPLSSSWFPAAGGVVGVSMYFAPCPPPNAAAVGSIPDLSSGGLLFLHPCGNRVCQ